MIDVPALHALRSVSSLGTLARAAEELGFTASAVSQQIKRLEHQLGVRVVAPAGRGIVLTPAGRAVVDSSAEVFEAMERCAEAARSVAGGLPQGTVHVVAFSTAIRGLVAPALRELLGEFPDLDIRVTEHDPDRALYSIESGTADVALVHDADGLPAPMASSMSHREIHVDIGDIVVHREHPLAQVASPLTTSALTGWSWVTSPPGTICHQWFRRLVAELPEHADVRHMVDDFSSQLALVASSNVVALIPRLARPPLGESLIALPLERPPLRRVHAAWRTSADSSPAIRAFVDALGVL